MEIVTAYCYGDSEALGQIQGYCAKGNCNDKVLRDIKQHCVGLGRSVNTEELLVADNASPAISAGITKVLTAFCNGDSRAREQVEDYCLHYGCDNAAIKTVKQFCQQQGSSAEMSTILAASAAYKMNVLRGSGDTQVSNQLGSQMNTPPSGAARSLVVSWSSPTQRVDGKALSTRELTGYEIYIISDGGGEGRRIVLNNPRATTYTIDNLSLGTYHVAVVAKDKDGIASELSAIVSTTISAADPR
jgi:hypothetical protein